MRHGTRTDFTAAVFTWCFAALAMAVGVALGIFLYVFFLVPIAMTAR